MQPPALAHISQQTLDVQHDFQALNDRSRQGKFCGIGSTLIMVPTLRPTSWCVLVPP